MVRLSTRARALGISSVLAIASLGILAPVPAAAESGGPLTWHITVGPEQGFTGLLRFYPSDITVHPGDTVKYRWAGFHTVTFNPPSSKSVLDYAFLGVATGTTLDSPGTFVSGSPNFGRSGPPPPFDLTIGTNLPTGTYRFKCMLHIGMQGAIHVTNGELPSSDTHNQTLAQGQIAADASRAAKLDSRLSGRSAEEEGIQVGASQNVVELTKFYPSSITIHSGDAVTFRDPDRGDPHTVTFGVDPRSPFGQLVPYGSPGNVSPGDTLSSGFLYSRQQFDYWNLRIAQGEGFQVQPPTTEYTTRFNNPGTKPATFAFYCELHGGIDPATGAVLGMSGYVTVLPARGDD
jgi:plastocyanin